MTMGPPPPKRPHPEESDVPVGHTIRPPGDHMTHHHTCHLCTRPSGDDANVCTSCADTARTALRAC